MRVCSNCTTTKPYSAFYYNDKKQRYSTYCRECTKARARQWWKSNPEARERYRTWCKHNVRKRKNYCLKRQFGITVTEYERLFELQHGTCGICGQKPNGKKLAVDHDHKTNEIRGLLCQHCNIHLAWMEQMPDFQQKAAAYLADSDGRLPRRA